MLSKLCSVSITDHQYIVRRYHVCMVEKEIQTVREWMIRNRKDEKIQFPFMYGINIEQSFFYIQNMYSLNAFKLRDSLRTKKGRERSQEFYIHASHFHFIHETQHVQKLQNSCMKVCDSTFETSRIIKY